MSTKVTGLTGLNVTAVRLAAEALGDDTLGVLAGLTATTFTYPGTPAEAIAWLDKGRQALVAGGYRGNAHPVRSLAAVRRKFAQQ
ncbi:hypothetical protein SEA_EDMUNDFERRY_8 [Gordonia phage EdmundFerry]|nr:hypothetical protein SEA_EDMUNDFERRY_8 [Gordonia phage EdmundFerry]